MMNSTDSASDKTGDLSIAGRVAVGDIKMYYEIHGRGGEPLLMIMGLGGHSLDWGWIVPQRLAESYRVILFDNRGAGRSDQPPGPLTIGQMAEYRWPMDAIVGVIMPMSSRSMGGMICKWPDFPERVDKPCWEQQLLVEGPEPSASEIQNYIYPRMDLSIHDYIWWTDVCYPQEFIDAHPSWRGRFWQPCFPGRLPP